MYVKYIISTKRYGKNGFGKEDILEERILNIQNYSDNILNENWDWYADFSDSSLLNFSDSKYDYLYSQEYYDLDLDLVSIWESGKDKSISDLDESQLVDLDIWEKSPFEFYEMWESELNEMYR